MRTLADSRAFAAPLLIRESRARPLAMSARDVALRILQRRFGPVPADTRGENGLTSFQHEAVRRARAVLARRGGVLIADSVGLGKTHIALALVLPYAEAGRKVLVVGPAALRSHWRTAAREGMAFDWLSYARLSRGQAADVRADVVVFDEAHTLRNPATARYRAAAMLCRGARVILLSATPVNNTVWDLYHLLRLFASDRDFLDVGVASLRSAFEEAESASLLGTAPSLQPVLRAVMIRRTRPFLRERMSVPDDGSPRLAFPRQKPPIAIRYGLTTGGSSDALLMIGATLLDLRFPAHVGANTSAGAGGAIAPAGLMRLGLLKRLESSAHALDRSVRAYASLLERCLEGVSHGVLIRARDDPARAMPDLQLRLDTLLFASPPRDFDLEAHRSRLERELATLGRIRVALAPALERDGKASALVDLLEGELRGHKVVLFTQFRDTARYLHARLCRRLRAGLIDGSMARLGAASVDRRTVVRRFAPVATEAPAPPPQEAIDVLVATDVLSEGFNLQDADSVISYDLPWNPVRLVQRIGRIDRLGSPHASVASYHFLPGDLERYLHLLDRIARKASAIDATVGSDMPALHAQLVRALDRRDPDILAQIEQADADWFEIEERLLETWVRAGQSGMERMELDAHSSIADPGRSETLAVGILAGSTSGHPGSAEFSAPAVGPAGTCALPAPTGLVAAEVGGRFEWVAVRAGKVIQDDRVCARMIESALRASATEPGGSGVPAESLASLLAAARPVFARRAAAASTAALLPAGGESARIGRLLLSLAAALPGGPDRATCQRLERGLERLASLPSAACLLPPAALTAGTSCAERLERLLDAIEAMQPGDASSAAPGRHSTARVELIGALLERAPLR